jgi:hypothetical protein
MSAAAKLARESNPAARFRRPGSDPSTEPSSIRRESNPRYALCRRAPCHSATDAHDHHLHLPTTQPEPPLGVEPSPLAYHASVPCRGHPDGDRRRSWRGPESNRPQPHCKCSSPPWYMPPQKHARSRRGSNSPSAVDSRASSPEDYGTNRNSRGVRRESNPYREIHGLACGPLQHAHHVDRDAWESCPVKESNLRRSLIGRQHLPLC